MEQKFDLYETITNNIIEQLKKGTIPWHKPWHTGDNLGAFSRVTKRPYSLLNQMCLKHIGEYATFDQWQKLGGKVKKGEHSEIVVFWKVNQKKNPNFKGYVEVDGKLTAIDGEKEFNNFPLLRYYRVFHISQVEGVEPLPSDELVFETPTIDRIEEVIKAYADETALTIQNGDKSGAYYSPMRDLVNVPPIENFENTDEYYSTMFHELTHSTGSVKRLNRDTFGTVTFFGSQDYSKEELVAELGSQFICNKLGISTEQTFQNSSAYIKSWIKVLQNDTKMIVSASSKAQKACEYLLGFSEEETEEVEETSPAEKPKIIIKNLSQLKKYIAVGKKFEIISHSRDDTYKGEIREIIKTRGNGYVSTPTDKNCKRYGKEIHEWYEKATTWKFEDDVITKLFFDGKECMKFRFI